ncbi:hypothetical protein Scep_008392 [Stephania cephalantha]|uniref:Epidermal patterning factor-like protein n=1 Tax=Stephania cephalantha TaxID=152367 RepID=A0AAP0PPK6_9MAGN
MASPKYPNGLAIVLAILIFSLSFQAFISVDSVSSSNGGSLKQRKKMLGSRPPSCINKCLSCIPCLPFPVIPPSQNQKTVLSQEETYYPVSWRCGCKNKVFHP